MLALADAFPHIAQSRQETPRDHFIQSTAFEWQIRRLITLFAVDEAVSERAMSGIEAGEWIVPTNVSDDVNDIVSGMKSWVDFEVYNSEVNTLACQATLLALADSDAVPDPANEAGFKHNRVSQEL